MPPFPPLPSLRPRRRCLLLHLRSIHAASSPSLALDLDLSHPTYMIWGSNTGVGKTLVSAGLADSVLSSPNSSTFLYVKPVQTGFPFDSDSRFVFRKASDLFRHRRRGSSHGLLASNHALGASIPASREILGFGTERSEEDEDENGVRGSILYEETRVGEGESEEGDFRLVCKTLYGWKEAVSSHLAVEREGMAVDDSSLREMLRRCLRFCSEDEGNKRMEGVWRVIETSGGVASPGPSGTLQCDLYRCVIFFL